MGDIVATPNFHRLMKTVKDVVPLVEFGSAVTVDFRDRLVPAYSDVDSGYVFFEPPSGDQLNDYYQREYPQIQAATGYYTPEADYDPWKNQYYADNLLGTYTSIMSNLPRSSLELGCAYGGLVAEMANRGIAAKGSDINRDAISQGTKTRGNSNIFHADCLSTVTDMDGQVDLIYSLGSLEHDPSMIKVIAASRRRLTDKGVIFLMVPNAMYAGSVFGGFKNNWWVNYPQHLHMLSPGFIPALCRNLGFLPVFWDTRILFEEQAQPAISGLFASDSHREIWNLLMLDAGLGMELNFALVPDSPFNMERFGKLTYDVGRTLEKARRHEVAIRRYLREARP